MIYVEGLIKIVEKKFNSIPKLISTISQYFQKFSPLSKLSPISFKKSEFSKLIQKCGRQFLHFFTHYEELINDMALKFSKLFYPFQLFLQFGLVGFRMA